MSSSNYRGRRGGGGYSKPKRYWDSDDYNKRGYRDHDRDRGRGRRSRSRDRDRSYSRSYSRSRSRSPAPHKDETHQPKQIPPPAPIIKASVPEVSQKVSSPYDPMFALNPGWAPVDNTPPPPKGIPTNGQYYGSGGESQTLYPSYPLKQQFGSSNLPASQKPISTAMTNEYGGIAIPDTYAVQQQGYTPAPIGTTARTTEESSENSAKILKKKEKKRNRSSSSSSSSLSSSDSSDSRGKNRGKKTDSSGSSSDSSSEDEKKSKKKDKKKDQPPPAAPVSANLSQQQRDILEKQQQNYKTKLDVLQREIKRLIAKEDELASMKADMKLIEENLKLQVELKNRVNAVKVVLEKIQDVLRGGSITADGKPRPAPPPPPKLSQSVAPPAPTIQVQHVTLVSRVALSEPNPDNSFSSMEFYDNGIHWCRLCNIFPDSVTELLDHFHSEDHHIQVEQLGIEEQPWHKKNVKETKTEPRAKKVPYRGMQFFTPVKGWYCKLCSCWIGDHHCSLEHLKSEEHHNSFMNFLTEHPDWESKYAGDREKARVRAGLGPDLKKAPKAQQVDLGGGVKYNPLQANSDDDGANTKSILVEMRRKAKEEEENNRLTTAHNQQKFPIGGLKETSAVDEWMGKPQKVPVDIIDTQKFVAIVRQKHGAEAKEDKKPPPSAPQFRDNNGREEAREQRGGREDTKSRNEVHKKPDLRVELSLGGRGRGGRDRGRRRSRSKSRSRSRSRGRYDRERDRGDRYSSRRKSSREKSRSRERERSRDKDKRKDTKPSEVVKRLPMIGKMPLFGRKLMNKEAKREDAPATLLNEIPPAASEYGPIPPPKVDLVEVSQALTPLAQPNPYETVDMTGVHGGGGYSYGYQMGVSSYGEGVGQYQYMEATAASAPPIIPALASPVSVIRVEEESEETLKPPGEKDDPPLSTTGKPLPDDLQHALDIIYHGVGGKPGSGPKAVTFPISDAPADAAQPSEDYSESSFNYMDYQPYQQSFEGYAPADYPDMDSAQKPVRRVSAYDEITAGSTKSTGEDDDMDDLRMLGIDVDDTAASYFK